MTRATIDSQEPELDEPVTDIRIVVIATNGPRDQIARVLEQADFAFETFDDTLTMLAADSPRPPGVLVVWCGDATSRLAAAIEPLTQRFARAPLVLVCERIDRRGVRSALAAGVAAVVPSERLDSTLGPTLHAAYAGQTCVPRQYWRQIEPPALSSREKQILGLVVMGYMNSEIAARLFLAESTVKSHLSSAFAKLGVRSRNEAVRLILDPDRGLGTGILSLSGPPENDHPRPGSSA